MMRHLGLTWFALCLFALQVPLAWAALLAPPGVQIRAEKVPSEAEKEYNAGLEALTAKGWDMASRHFRASAKLDPHWSAPILGLAEVALRQDDLQQAERLLSDALKRFPEESTVQTAWGRFALAQGQAEKAEAAFVRASELAPDEVDPYLDLGALYSNAQPRPQRAVEAFEAAIRLKPMHAGAHHGLGMALSQLGEPQRAEQEFQRAAQLAPTNPIPRHALGRLYATSNRLDEALAAYSEAIRLQPNLVVSRVDRGRIYLHRHQWQAARDDFRAATELAPANAEAQLGLGQVSQQLGDVQAANKAYRAAIRANPKLALAYNNLAWLQAAAGEVSPEAVEWARRAVELAPQTSAFRDTLGWLLHLQGDHVNAKAELERAAQQEATADILYHLGAVYAALGERGPAREALSQALAKGDTFEGEPHARALLGQLR